MDNASNKPALCLSLDLDNQWSYMKTQGEPDWQSFPSYLDQFVEKAIPIFKRYNLDLTVFIIGQDAALEKNHSALQALAAEGYEIANHSFSHEPWFHQYDKAKITEEITKASDSISAVTGEKPVGFRGPGFCHSPTMLQTLSELGYQYDASQFPTFLGPIARFYFYCHAGDLSAEEKQQRASLFGKFSDGFQSLRPYRHMLGNNTLIEAPVTTMPVLKLPFHQSYVSYLSTWNKSLGLMYARLSFLMCRAFKVTPSFLLHPTDFLGGDDVPGMEFFPGMQLPGEEKRAQTEKVLEYIVEHFNVTNMRDYCSSIDSPQLPKRTAS